MTKIRNARKSRTMAALVVLACGILIPSEKTIAQSVSPAFESDREPAKLNFSPDSRPFHKSFSEWSAEWWQFIFSLPASGNPILDSTGEACSVGQHGPVWFLAGSFDTKPVLRTCSIPERKALFLPVVNRIDINDPKHPQTAAELRAEIAPCVDAATGLSVEVDGEPVKRLEKSRVKSVVFELTVPENGLIDAGIYSPAVDDGFYVMLRPLPAGQHTIHITGVEPEVETCNALNIDITYSLTVVPVDLGRSR